MERILQGISRDSGNAGDESPITGGDVADGVNSTLVAGLLGWMLWSCVCQHENICDIVWKSCTPPGWTTLLSLPGKVSIRVHPPAEALIEENESVFILSLSQRSAESRDEIPSPLTHTSPGAQMMWFHQRQFADTREAAARTSWWRAHWKSSELCSSTSKGRRRGGCLWERSRLTSTPPSLCFSLRDWVHRRGCSSALHYSFNKLLLRQQNDFRICFLESVIIDVLNWCWSNKWLIYFLVFLFLQFKCQILSVSVAETHMHYLHTWWEVKFSAQYEVNNANI